LGFGIWGLGFGVWVWGLGFGVWCLLLPTCLPVLPIYRPVGTAHPPPNWNLRRLPQDPLTGKKGLFCAKGGFCDYCSFCHKDADDSVDNVCPTKQCVGSGRLPQCISAAKLAAAHWSCQDAYPFEVWAYQDKSEGAPTIVMPSSPVQRFLTPGNQVIGGAGMVVRRGKPEACPPSANVHLHNWSATAGVCLDDSDWEAAAYGYDPVFLASSPLYNGNLRIQDFYSKSERRNSSDAAAPSRRALVASAAGSSAGGAGGEAAVAEAAGGDGMPFVFFPHAYDAVQRAGKNASLVVEEFKDAYLVFLDARLSSAAGAHVVALLQVPALMSHIICGLGHISYRRTPPLAPTCTCTLDRGRVI